MSTEKQELAHYFSQMKRRIPKRQSFTVVSGDGVERRSVVISCRLLSKTTESVLCADGVSIDLGGTIVRIRPALKYRGGTSSS